MVNLRIPGPTPCRAEIYEAVSRPMMNYRGPEVAALTRRLVQDLGSFLETKLSPVLLTASGTGGLEAAVTNSLRTGDRVVGVSGGVFGERFCSVAEAYGLKVDRLSVEWGRAADPEALRALMRAGDPCRAVLMTHNETSTAITHPIEALCGVVRDESDALVLVDGVSSLAAIPLSMDRLGIDVVVTGSQKAWGVPPGIVMLFLSERAWVATEKANLPRFYFDLRRYREALGRGTFPFTPALSIVYALSKSLELLLQETAATVYERHARLAERVRSGVARLGLDLFADPAHASATVTAFHLPDGVEEAELVDCLRTRYDTVLARGQGKLQGRILRIGHLGWVTEQELDDATSALGRALSDLGYS